MKRWSLIKHSGRRGCDNDVAAPPAINKGSTSWRPEHLRRRRCSSSRLNLSLFTRHGDPLQRNTRGLFSPRRSQNDRHLPFSQPFTWGNLRRAVREVRGLGAGPAHSRPSLVYAQHSRPPTFIRLKKCENLNYLGDKYIYICIFSLSF